MILFEKTGWIMEDSSVSGNRRTSISPPDTAPDGPVSRSPPPANEEAAREGEEDAMIVRSPDRRTRIRLLHEYTFTSSLRRMSVFVHVHTAGDTGTGSGLYVLCKGAPETVASLCSADSVPSNFASVLESFAKCGYRVIALASRHVDDQLDKAEHHLRTPRVELERGMKFLGFVVFENRLKEQTIPNITILKTARMRTVMVTGDNMLTAVSVAKECGMLDERRPIYTIEAELVNEQPKISLHLETNENERMVSSARKRDEEHMKRVVLDMENGNHKTKKGRDKRAKGLEATYQLAISGKKIL